MDISWSHLAHLSQSLPSGNIKKTILLLRLIRDKLHEQSTSKKTNGHTMLQASFLEFWCKTLPSGFIAVLRSYHYSVQIQHSACFRGSEVKCNLHQRQRATIALECLSIPQQQPNERAEQPSHSSLAIFPKQQSQSVLAFVFKAVVSHIFIIYWCDFCSPIFCIYS